MSLPLPFDEPSPQEVIELLQRLEWKNELRRRYLSGTATILVLGMVLSLYGSFPALNGQGNFLLMFGLTLLAGGTIGVCYLALPDELIRIARRLEKSTDPNTISPLIDALETALKVSSNNGAVKQLRRTLATLLARLLADDSIVLSERNWETLRQHLAFHATLHFILDQNDLALTLAVLDLIKRRRDTRFIATIRNISFVFGAKGSEMRQAVQDCLVVLEEQKRKEDESKILLRASEPKSHSDTLLRPAAYGSEVQAQELLRADLSQHS